MPSQDELQLPQGSFAVAHQTRQALQSCAAASLNIAVNKPANWEPWRHGHQRLSEGSALDIFGFLWHSLDYVEAF